MAEAARWNRVARLYRRVAGRGVLGRGRRQAVEWLAARPGERILLAGCGPGYEFPWLPPEVFACGADLARQMLALATRQPGCAGGVVADAQRLPFGDGLFDGVVLSLICAVAPDGAAVLAEALRVTRPGGRVLVFDKLRVGPDRWWRQALTGFSRRVGSDFNRPAEAVWTGLGAAVLERHEPVGRSGFFHLWRIAV